jgi:hypothetical protein
MIQRIYLDLDGVVRDWIGGINNLFGTDFKEEEITRWNYITDYMMNYFRMPEQHFWNYQDKEFWTTLKFTPEAEELLSYLESTKLQVFLFSSPTLNNAGWSQQWVRQNLPSYFNDKRYILGPTKWICANPASLLIDDAEKNIMPWIKAGGIGLLWPKPWNYAYGIEDGLVMLKELIDFHNN